MMYVRPLLFLLNLVIIRAKSDEIIKRSFPKEFLFGVSTSAYQIEGAWNESGKGENIWDRYIHENPTNILGGSNADIACDSYHKYTEDVKLLKHLGVQFYRFSLSWSRILPTGLSYNVNQNGVDYYNSLIDLLLENNIIPMVTLFHGDTPQPLEEMGGFATELMVEWFRDYARLAFELFGNRVKFWITFNEPARICSEGYGMDIKAPAYNLSGIGDYLCAHNILKAHAEVYHMYKNHFKLQQQGKIGISIDSPWFEPSSTSKNDLQATQRAFDFWFGWFADPIFHVNGDYPTSMKKNIRKRSISEGFGRSRMPNFSQQEIQQLKGSADYLGLNYFTTKFVSDIAEEPIGDQSYEKDRGVRIHLNHPEDLHELKVISWGFRNLLSYINNRYKNLEIYITENGVSDDGELNDRKRIDYISANLHAVLGAIFEDNVNVKSYAIWSLMDNFDWKHGYSLKYGLYKVDFASPNRTRLPKASVKFYREVMSNRRLPGNNCDSIYSTKIVLLLIFIGVFLNVH